MKTLSEKEFLTLSKKGNLIPVTKEVTGDLETPVSAYAKISKKSKYSFLLESVEGEAKIAQYSFVAKDPELVFESKNNTVKITTFTGKNKKIVNKKIIDTPLTFIRQLVKKYKFVNIASLPRFCGGMVGFMSYDIVRFFEEIPRKTKDTLKLPDTLLILAKNLIIFDHRHQKIKFVHCVHINPDASILSKKRAYKKALREIEANIALLKHSSLSKKNPGLKPSKQVKLSVRSNVSNAQFKKMVNKAKEQIRAGEIIQVVLSQRFEVNLKTDPFNIYRSLRTLNPSPYMYYLNFGKTQIVGSSPELLVRCEKGVVETRPIAGTRPRGKTKKEDDQYADDLLKDPKERAEHIMLVDLGRNDLGRVCKKGTVNLSEFMKIERYSHVMHIVSNVKGQLNKKHDDLDVLQSAFPAGTVSGAPKIRAMEIIEDLEKERRGPYAGCIGYLSFSGNLDSCITIRTIVVSKGKAYIQAGAGIVADSNPQKEYQETKNKAKAQIKAIELAHQHYS